MIDKPTAGSSATNVVYCSIRAMMLLRTTFLQKNSLLSALVLGLYQRYFFGSLIPRQLCTALVWQTMGISTWRKSEILSTGQYLTLRNILHCLSSASGRRVFNTYSFANIFGFLMPSFKLHVQKGF